MSYGMNDRWSRNRPHNLSCNKEHGCAEADLARGQLTQSRY